MRILVPILAAIVAAAVVAGVFVNSGRQAAQRAAAPSPAQQAADTPGSDAADTASADPAPSASRQRGASPDAQRPNPDATDAPSRSGQEPAVARDRASAQEPRSQASVGPGDLAELTGLHVLPVPDARDVSIGSDDPDGPYRLRADLKRFGAAVERITLADYRKRVDAPDRYVIAERVEGPGYRRYPFAVHAVQINGERVVLEAEPWETRNRHHDDRRSSVTYRLVIADADDRPVLEILRTYELTADGYDITLRQELRNRTDTPLEVVWQQNIQGDIINDDAAYLGDRRMFEAGYFDDGYDPRRVRIYSDHTLTSRDALVSAVRATQQQYWPNPSVPAQSTLVWVASLNRYFTVTTHPIVPDTATVTADVPPLETTFPRVGVEAYPPGPTDLPAAEQSVLLTLDSAPQTLAPGQTADLSLGIYAGPRKKDTFAEHPYSLMHFDELIRYSLGGPCAFCTFQWLAKALLGFLEFIHAILGDWGIAIIILVLVVRLLLHPLTKRAQVNMMKFGKQMQAMQPELDKLRKKYKDEPQRFQQEQIKLFREKGVNPASMLGCLPMFLQMPIWIALYAMLYYAIELRHEPAFYGVFQAISGGSWHFLADLSSSDQFIRVFAEPKEISLIFFSLNFQSINLLPLLMIIVFYFQQKLMTPPPANEQQAQQQKIMKFMMLLFPLLLYSAPSGLTLYILASTGAGIVDSYIVRKHVKEQEEAGTLFQPKPRKPGGLMDRLATTMEQKQKELAAKQQQLESRRAGGGGGGKGRGRKSRPR